MEKRFVLGAWVILTYSLGAYSPVESSSVGFSTHMQPVAFAVANPITEQDDDVRFATVTAYTCDTSMNAAQKAMNCPNGITATGTVPRHKQTAACDRGNLGRTFHVEGIGVIACEDTGGAIQGPGRFDLYVDTYAEAVAFGIQNIAYQQLTN